jgi:hypothetical protein
MRPGLLCATMQATIKAIQQKTGLKDLSLRDVPMDSFQVCLCSRTALDRRQLSWKVSGVTKAVGWQSAFDLRSRTESARLAAVYCVNGGLGAGLC